MAEAVGGSVGGDGGSGAGAPSPGVGSAGPGAASPASPGSGQGSAPQAPSAASVRGSEGRDPATGRFQPGSGSKQTKRGPRLQGNLEEIPDSDFEGGTPVTGIEAPGEGRGPDAGPQPLEAAPVPAKFRIEGIGEFDSEAHAAQSIKSLRGQFKHLNDTIETLKSHNEQNRRAAEAWQRRANLSAQGTQPAQDSKTPGQGTKTDAKAGAAPAPEASGPDLALYRAIAEQNGPEVAAVWLFQEGIKQATETLRADFGKQLQDGLAPFQQSAAYNQKAERAAGVYNSLENHVIQGPDGQPRLAYPELQDQNAAAVIGELWSRLPFTDEFRYQPAALHMAVVAYRDLVGYAGSGAAAYPQSPTNPVAPAQGASQAAAAVTAALTGSQATGDALNGGGAPYSRPAAGGVLSEAEEIRRGIDAASSPDPKTGVYRR